MSIFRLLMNAAAALAVAPSALAAVVWDESTAGDLSNVGTNPTFVALSTGSNQILGSTGNLGSGTDLDYFRITVPVGSQLTSLVVLPVTAPESLAFIGMEIGTQVTTFTAAGLLGWTHYGAFDAGFNILPRMGTGFGASGFSGPLPAGNYAFWIQDFDFGASPYGFDLTVVAVPEPGPATALSAGLAGLAGLAWRRRRQLPRQDPVPAGTSIPGLRPGDLGAG